ncbi:NADPH-dependent conjugated polyketone reductase C2 [Symbiodinium microadriaticum]|uniref:NADPH-dependent conjugated polyketone reductase C2 n=1 Tax=Symbiodinium microadriaticum TaxID=2951 RepID=A0A1Q9CH01_SYMMI|nr:NADPH-dependent conjugated polyketone reductase C2 [Symbiodinium microadriaticum]
MSGCSRLARQRGRIGAALSRPAQVGKLLRDCRTTWRIHLEGPGGPARIEVRSPSYGDKKLFRGTLRLSGTVAREGAFAMTMDLNIACGAYLAAGGRLIDTAQGYGNHLDIGEAIRQSAVPRDDLWVTSKVRVRACNTAADVVRAVNKSLEQLGLEYLDLMLLHGGDGWGIGPERDEALWRGLIETQQSGKVRSIGVSNHNREEIDRLISSTGVTPAVNQLEFHPWVPAETRDLVRWCQGKGIAVTAYGSLGGSQNKARGEAAAKIAEKYGKTSAQVLLRWALDQGVAVIPGASSEEHIREDLDLTGFALTSEDAKLLESVEAPTNFTRWHNCKTGCAA